MTEKVRLRVWLAGGAPLVVVGAFGVYLLASSKDPAPRHPPSYAEQATEPPSPSMVTAPLPTAATAGPLRPPLPGAATATAAPQATAPVDPEGVQPERVPEVEAMFALPPGSERWSDEQKKAYRVKTFQDLEARERTLESEIAAAHRSGDRQTEQRKTATLSYLREKRALVEGMLRHGNADGDR